jgi:hypothetical protein
MTRAAGDLLDSLQDPDSRETSTQAHDARGSVEVLRCGCGGSLEVPVPPPPASGGLLKAVVVACPACQAPLTMDPNVGRVLARQLRLERRLGHGGMGSVYLATELRLDRKVAVKVLHQHLAAIPEFRERFEREARVMARLEHSNLATLFAVEVDQQVPFLVMKVVRGHTLARLVMKRPSGWALCDVLPIVKQVGAGLSELHRCGFVHRDLKPGNIMVTAQGHVTLLDYGLTRTVESALTKPGVVLGSPQFMSPEQVTAHPLDARSDQYSLALLCSLLLTGKLPYETLSEEYELEYGSASIEVHSDAIRPGARVLLIDDLIATGGTMGAAVSLLRRLGAGAVTPAVIIDLPDLGGSKALAADGCAPFVVCAFEGH